MNWGGIMSVVKMGKASLEIVDALVPYLRYRLMRLTGTMHARKSTNEFGARRKEVPGSVQRKKLFMNPISSESRLKRKVDRPQLDVIFLSFFFSVMTTA